MATVLRKTYSTHRIYVNEACQGYTPLAYSHITYDETVVRILTVINTEMVRTSVL